MKSLKLVMVMALIFVPVIAFSATPDIYEDDNSFDKAGVISISSESPQHHNFHVSGDQDWMKFYALAGETYDIRVKNITGCDVIVELYQPDGITPVKDQIGNNITGWGEAGQEVFLSLSQSFSTDGVYFIKLSAFNNVYGDNTGYDITVSKQTAGDEGFVAGKVFNSLGNPIKDVRIRTTGSSSDISRENGDYKITDSPGNPTLIAEKEGYQKFEISVTIQKATETKQDITMYFLGDLNRDRKIDLADAIIVLRILTGIQLQETVYKQADVNGDGRISLEEVIYALQKVAGLR